MSSENIEPPTTDERLLKFLLHIGFLVSGATTVLIGQVLPILANRLALDDTQAGYFFIAQFSGSLAGTLLTQPMIRRFGFGAATSLGLAAMMIGVLGLNFDSRLLCSAAFVVNGFGIGVTLPSINMLTVELNPQRVAPALNFLNFFWGVGAIFCQPFVSVFGTATSVLLPTAILAGLLLTIVLPTALATRGERRKEVVAESADGMPPIWTTRTAWLIAFFNFVHVGFESGMGGWITTYSARLTDQPTENFGWLSPTLAYFSLFVAGRLTAPLYAGRLGENKLLLLSLLVMAAGVLILISAGGFGILIVGAAIAGFGTSAIFPTNAARFTKTFGATATRRATPLFVSGTLGAALTTWLIGYVSTNYQNLRVGMFVLLGSCFVLICVQVFLLAASLESQDNSADS